MISAMSESKMQVDYVWASQYFKFPMFVFDRELACPPAEILKTITPRIADIKLQQ
jgi:hypothetical protein